MGNALGIKKLLNVYDWQSYTSSVMLILDKVLTCISHYKFNGNNLTSSVMKCVDKQASTR
jgi:hypothetical protein